MRLKRETPPSDTPLTGPPRWLPDPQLIELRREEHQALRELHAFLMGMHDDRIRRETRENGPGRITSRRTTTNRYRAFLTSTTATSRRRAVNS